MRWEENHGLPEVPGGSSSKRLLSAPTTESEPTDPPEPVPLPPLIAPPTRMMPGVNALQPEEVRMMDRPRPRWLTILLFILPHVIGLILLLVAIVWGLTQSTSSEARAVAGALAIWLGENAVVLLYWAIRYSYAKNPDHFIVNVHAVVVKRQRLIALARNAGPGLWIGLVSRSPV